MVHSHKQTAVDHATSIQVGTSILEIFFTAIRQCIQATLHNQPNQLIENDEINGDFLMK